MLFWLKKFIAFWLMPMSFTVAAMIAGLWLMRSPKRARLGRWLALSGLVLLLLFSNKYVSRALIRPIEATYPAMPELTAGAPVPAELAACRYVVVLGGGHGETPGMSANNQLSAPSLGRVTEAVRLMRVLPDAKLIVSGPGWKNHETHASVLARAAQVFGVPADRILRIEEVRDTEDESLSVKRITGDARVALVTSAVHMPRSMALFRSAGVPALACPADFVSHSGDVFYFTGLFWDPGALGASTVAIREYIGYLWIWLRGKT